MDDPSFNEQLWLIIIDKGFLAILLGVGAGVVKWLLQIDQSRRELLKEISSKRADVYATLWKTTRPADLSKLNIDKVQELLKNLDKLYYEDGGAMYLSHKAVGCLFAIRNTLYKLINTLSKDKRIELTESERKELKNNVSNLRTQFKQDMGVYSKKDASRQSPYL